MASNNPEGLSDPDGGETAAMEYFEKKTPSALPYFILRHRRTGKLRYLHGRSKEHALKHLDMRTGWLAIFWLLVFVGVMACLFILLRDLILTYLSNPIATQILTENTQLMFPDVTVCPVSPFSKSLMTPEELQQMDDLKQRVIDKLVYAGLHLTDPNIQAERSQSESFKHLVYCQYNGEQCSFANFTEIVHLRYMHCYTFSPRPEKRHVTAGSGLTFIYLAEQDGGPSDPYMLLNDLESQMFNETPYDGINVFVHNPATFPGYEINQMPTSFAVHFGQIARIGVGGLQYQSNMEGSKQCVLESQPYMYKSFGGSLKYLQYEYTYEDCVANRKQSYLLEQCNCYSDLLQVPYIREPDDDPEAKGVAMVLDFSKLRVDFCRDIRSRTSQMTRRNFECHERLIKLPTSKVIDAYVNPDLLYNARDDPDETKRLRQGVCPAQCTTMLYDTRHVHLTELHENYTLNLPSLTKHLRDLNRSTIAGNTTLHQIWYSMTVDGSEILHVANASNLAIVDVRLSRERIDIWHEQVTSSLFGLMANIGGTLGLCAGISFLSAFFLLLFFGNAMYHALMALGYYFWWTVYQGSPKAAEIDELMAAEAHSVAIEKRLVSERPYTSSRHMRAVSRVIVDEKKGTVFDPWDATRIQYNLKLGDDHIPNKTGEAFKSPSKRIDVAGDGEQSPNLPALQIGAERVSYNRSSKAALRQNSPHFSSDTLNLPQQHLEQPRVGEGWSDGGMSPEGILAEESTRFSIDDHIDSMLKRLRRLPSTRSRRGDSPSQPECVRFQCEEEDEEQVPCVQMLSFNEVCSNETSAGLRRRRTGCETRLECEEITEPPSQQHFIAHPDNVQNGCVNFLVSCCDPAQTHIQVEELPQQPVLPESPQEHQNQYLPTRLPREWHQQSIPSCAPLEFPQKQQLSTRSSFEIPSQLLPSRQSMQRHQQSEQCEQSQNPEETFQATEQLEGAQ